MPDDKTPMSPWKYVAPHKPPPKGGYHRNGKTKSRYGIGTANVGADYTDDEKEWLRAVQDFMAKHRRYPTMQEAFAIAYALGYRKQEEGV